MRKQWMGWQPRFTEMEAHCQPTKLTKPPIEDSSVSFGSCQFRVNVEETCPGPERPGDPMPVTLRGDVVVDWRVVTRLVELEMRGCTFHVEADGRYGVTPAGLLTPDDRAFLQKHRAAVRQVLAYHAPEFVQ
jgi:hypothetical protein